MSASVISFSLEWDLKFFSNCRMLVLMSCHRKAEKKKYINDTRRLFWQSKHSSHINLNSGYFSLKIMVISITIAVKAKSSCACFLWQRFEPGKS
jgi:hypothetical protein